MKNNKGFAPIAIVLIIVAILLVGGGVYVYTQKEPATDNSWLASTNPPKPDLTKTPQPQTQVVVPSKADTLAKLKAANPTETKVISAAWTNAEKLSADNSIKKLIADSRNQAEMYYGVTNGNSYANVCTNTNGLLGTRNELGKLLGSVVCKDSSTAWAISAQLTNSTPQYQCADNLGSFIVRDSSITTTKCN